MKKNLMIVLVACFLLSGCFKDDVHNNADSTAVTAIMNGGTDNLSSNVLGLAGYDSTIFYITAGISTPYTINKNITITLQVNDAARLAYNESHAVQYDSLPDSLYSFTTTSALLTAGARSINIPITIYGGKANLTKNYMLAISIKDAQGVGISSDLGTLYFNQLGSVIAGRYAVTGTRTDYTGPVSNGVVSSVSDLSVIGTKVGVAASADVVIIDYADLGNAGWQYIVTYNPTDKSVSIAPNSVILNNDTGVENDSFKIDTADYNPVTKVLHFKTEYMNDLGDARVIDEYLTPQ